MAQYRNHSCRWKECTELLDGPVFPKSTWEKIRYYVCEQCGAIRKKVLYTIDPTKRKIEERWLMVNFLLYPLLGLVICCMAPVLFIQTIIGARERKKRMTGTCEPLRNKPLTIHYCLGMDCKKQCVKGSMEWTDKLDLTKLSTQPTMMMGYCPDHDPNQWPFGVVDGWYGFTHAERSVIRISCAGRHM